MNTNKFESLNIIPKQKLPTPFWVNPLIWFFSFVLFGLVGLFIFYYFEVSSLQSKAKEKESDYFALSTPENKALEDRVRGISQQLEKFSQIFSNHKISYIFFDFLRTNCHPNVRFSSLDLSPASGLVSLSGETSDYKSLQEQVLVLKNIKEISSLDVSDIILDKEGKITFKISFIIDPKFFNNQNQ